MRPEDRPQREGTRERRADIASQAIETIERWAYHPSISLDYVADTIEQPRRTVQRALLLRGTTFRNKLAEVRMERAKALLAEGRNPDTGEGIPVREVAERVGYTQPAQFAKAFRRIVGISPSNYRKEVIA